MRGVNHDGFHVGINREVFEHGLPDASFRPAVESLVDAVPIAVFLRQEPPLNAAASHVKNCVQEAFAGGWLADVEVSSGSQEF